MPTPLRNIRIDDELYAAVNKKAKAEGRNVSEVVRELLTVWADVRETPLQRHARMFNAGEMDKFEFYYATQNYTARQVAEAAGIELGVVQDRRRYLRQLAKQTAR